MMTDVSNVKSDTQVQNLRSATSQAPVNSDGDTRLANKIEDIKTEESLTLSDGQDPLEQAARVIEKFVPEDLNTKLRIDKDDDTGRYVYQSVDAESGEVVNQFPPESILEMIAFYRNLEGLIVDDNA